MSIASTVEDKGRVSSRTPADGWRGSFSYEEKTSKSGRYTKGTIIEEGMQRQCFLEIRGNKKKGRTGKCFKGPDSRIRRKTAKIYSNYGELPRRASNLWAMRANIEVPYRQRRDARQ